MTTVKEYKKYEHGGEHKDEMSRKERRKLDREETKLERDIRKYTPEEYRAMLRKKNKRKKKIKKVVSAPRRAVEAIARKARARKQANRLRSSASGAGSGNCTDAGCSAYN